MFKLWLKTNPDESRNGKILKKLAVILCLLATTVLTEVHWAVMQTVTWVSMIQTSEAPLSLGEKILSTISGEAPCEHCEAIAEEKSSSRSEVLSLLHQGPVLGPLQRKVARPARHEVFLFSLARESALPDLGSPAPLVPPPRRVS